MSSAESSGPFARRTVVLGIVASVIAGLLFFVLATYAPSAASNIGVTASPASNSAVGYSGFVRLLEEAGPPTRQVTRMEELQDVGTVIVFIDMVDDPDLVRAIVKARQGEPTLFVLPKWEVVAQAFNDAKVMQTGPYDADALDRLIQPIADAGVVVRDGGGTGYLRGVRVRLLRSMHIAADAPPLDGDDPAGLVIEGRDARHYVLIDPDLINNAGIDDIANARAMFALIDDISGTGDTIFIATPRLGSASGRSLGKLLLDPPFLPLTLILLFTGLLALLHGFVRFGPVAPRGRVFAFGKRALVDTTADLLARAGKLPGLGPRYADTMRRRAAERLGAPPSLSGERLQEWLDLRGRRQGDAEPFTQRSQALDSITSEEELHRRARALASWIEGQT